MERRPDNVLAFPQARDAIELRHLRAFVAVAEELNFSRAADGLHMSQSALSRQISSLEKLIGCALLRRSTHRVELTLAGEALLERTRRLLEDVNEAVTRTQSVGGELAYRLTQYWAPIFASAEDGISLAERRAAIEALCAQFPPPPGTAIEPVNAGGLPSFRIGPDPSRPAKVMYLHGGAHTFGSAYGHRGVIGALAAAADQTVLGPEYRLAPEHPFPAGLEDAERAYDWMIGDGVRPQPDRDRGRLVRRRPGDGAAAQAARARGSRCPAAPSGSARGSTSRAARCGSPPSTIRSPRAWLAWCSRSRRATSGTTRSTSRC